MSEYEKNGWSHGTFKVEIELPVEFKRDFTEIGMFENKNKMAECFDRILSAIRCKDVSSIWDYEREIIEVMKVAMGNAVMSSSEKPNKWIKVSEDMPIIGQNVLVCDLDGDMYITSLHLDGGWGFDEIGNKIKNIVAWMELPPVPERGTIWEK